MLWILVARNTAWKETGMRHAVLGRRHVFRRQIGRTSRWTCLTLDVPPHVQAGRASHCTTVQSDDLNDELLKSQLRYLESDELELKYREYVQSTDGRRQTYSWAEFKLLADAAAGPVDPRVTPMYATLTLSFVAQGTQFPVLPLLARSFELSPADLGLVTAATAAARLVTNAPAANLAERLGRKPLLIAGPLMAAGGCGVLGVATTFSELVVANLCVGAGLATTMAGASLYLADIATPRNRAQTTAPILQSALLGYAIGPAVGGYLASSYGMQTPFVVCAGALVASSAASAALLPETLHACPRSATTTGTDGGQATTSKSTDGGSMWRQLMRRPALQGLGGVVFMNGFTQGGFPITVVLFAVEHCGMSSAHVGLMMMANVALMVLTTGPATRLSDRLSSRKSIMVPAMSAAALFTAAQPLASDGLQFSVLVGLTGLAQAASMPSISPLVLDSVTASERASALAGRQMMQDAGTLLGATSIGALASVLGVPAAIEAVALLQGASVIFFALRVPGPLSSTETAHCKVGRLPPK